jgi:hypothetical protein
MFRAGGRSSPSTRRPPTRSSARGCRRKTCATPTPAATPPPDPWAGLYFEQPSCLSRLDRGQFFKGTSWRMAQGCQMVCFQNKNPNLGKFWRVLQWKILVYFTTIRSILRPLEINYCHLLYFVVVWYIFPRFGILYKEKSGNPGMAH